MFVLGGALILLAIWNNYQFTLQYGFVLVSVILLLLSRSLTNLRRVQVVLFASFFVSFFTWALAGGEGTPIWGPITVEALIEGQQAFIRVASGVVISIWFLSTTRNEEMIVGLTRLKVPYRAGFAFGMILRLAPTLITVTNTIVQAQQSRGLQLAGDWFWKKLLKYIPLFIPAFAGAIRNTNQFTMAIESRGFGYRPDRTNLIELRFSSDDYFVLLVTFVVVALGIYLDVVGIG
jgi:energy-coupling factor transport system permease protein